MFLDNFEIASLPTTTAQGKNDPPRTFLKLIPPERKRLLQFVVCGGGPTGVETAAVSNYININPNLRSIDVPQEIYDLCQEDILNYVRSTLSTGIFLINSSTPNYAGKKLESMSFSHATTFSIPTRKVFPSMRRRSSTEMVLRLFSTHESRRSIRIAYVIRSKNKMRRVRQYLLKGMCQQILFFGAT